MRALSQPRETELWSRLRTPGPSFGRPPLLRRGAPPRVSAWGAPQGSKEPKEASSASTSLPAGSQKEQPFLLKGVSQPGGAAAPKAAPRAHSCDGKLPSFTKAPKPLDTIPSVSTGAPATPGTPTAAQARAAERSDRTKRQSSATPPIPRSSRPSTARRPSSAAARQVAPAAVPTPPPARSSTPTFKKRPAVAPKPRPQQPHSSRERRAASHTSVRRPTSTPPASSRAMSRMMTAPARPVQDDLDSDSSEDEEAAELCQFWQNVRRLQVEAILANSANLDRAPPPPQTFTEITGIVTSSPREGKKGRGAWAQDTYSTPPKVDKERFTFSSPPARRPATARDRTVTSPVETRTTYELLKRDAREARTAASTAFSPCLRHLRPGESPPLNSAGSGWLRLWRCPAEVTLEVLCFIQADDVWSLLQACKTTREACSVHTSSGWFIVLPHLILSSTVGSTQLKRIWLPRTLWLEGRDLDTSASQSLLTGLTCTGARAARALLTLDLRNTKLSSATSLVSVVRSCRSLGSLNVSRTKLRDLGASHLLSGLVFDPCTGIHSPHTMLRYLSLEDNRLTAEVGRQLARVAVDTPLEVLLLGSNELRDEGVEDLAAAIAGTGEFCTHGQRTSVRLTRLDVSRNRLTSCGFSSLVGSFSSNRTLRILETGGNEDIGNGIMVSNDCAANLASSLMSAQALEQLHLWNCGINDNVFNIIAESWPQQMSIVNLASNPLSPSLKRLIEGDPRGIVRL